MKKSDEFFALIERVGKQEKMSDEDIKRVIDTIRAELGGKHISIPGGSKEVAGNRNNKIVRDRENGIQVSVIADKYQLSRAAVYKILRLKKRN